MRWNVMLGALGALEVWLAATAAGPARILGVLGGLLIVGTAALRPRGWWAPALVGVGALPLAVLTWWSVTTPLLALLAIGFAAAAARVPGRPA